MSKPNWKETAGRIDEILEKHGVESARQKIEKGLQSLSPKYPMTKRFHDLNNGHQWDKLSALLGDLSLDSGKTSAPAIELAVEVDRQIRLAKNFSKDDGALLLNGLLKEDIACHRELKAFRDSL